MNHVPKGIEALQHIAKDSSLLQPHPFVEAASAGVELALQKKSTFHLLREGMEAREDASSIAKREDSLPYLYNLFGHMVTYHLRNGGIEGGEEALMELIAEPNNPKNPLHNRNFWFRTINGLAEQQDSMHWIDLRLKDTQTCVPSRARTVVAALACLGVMRETQETLADVDLQNIKLLDFGGSTGFVSAALLEAWENPDYQVFWYDKDNKRHPIDMKVSQATVVDIFEGETQDSIPSSWPRNCSLPIKECTPENVSKYEKRMLEVRRLEREGKLVFKKMIQGYTEEELVQVANKIDANVTIELTVLHQLTPEMRAATDRAFKDRAKVVSDFANLPAFSGTRLIYSDKRWHNTRNKFPYRTFIKTPHTSRYHEVGGWGTSRTLQEDFGTTPRSLLNKLGITSISTSDDFAD